MVTIGCLMACGHSYDQILSWTFPQIELAAESIARHRAAMIDAIVSPVVEGLDKEYKPSKVNIKGRRKPTSHPPRRRKPTRKPKSKLTPQQREERLMMQLALAKVPVVVKNGNGGS